MFNKKRVSEQVILDRLASIEKTQKFILDNQKKMLTGQNVLNSEEQQVISLEKTEVEEEKAVEKDEKLELEELKNLHVMEEKLEKELSTSPLKRITLRDVTKGIIGAFIGIVSHFAFAEGVVISADFDFLRSTLLLITSFIIIIMFIYFAGFRKINDEFVTKFLPIRAIALYFSAILTIIVVLFIYGKISIYTPFMTVYNHIAAISVLAVLGAGTADLIGKNEE